MLLPVARQVFAAVPAPPNIVLIMADDLGFSDLGCYGSEIKTPNLDALAGKGLRFTQFYNTAKCHSSRVSLLTGLYCDQAGGAKLSRGATIAEVLSRAGYSTAMVGKWHLDQEPTDFGFERYWGHLSGATNFFTGDDTFRLNGGKWGVPKMLNGRPFYTTHAVTDFAIKFLGEATSMDKPFLLYTAFNAPHYPLQAPEEEVKKYDGRYDGGWDKLRMERHQRQLESGLLPAKWKLSPRPGHIPAWDSLSEDEQQWEADRMEVFAAMVDVLDQNVGRLVDCLKKIPAHCALAGGVENQTRVGHPPTRPPDRFHGHLRRPRWCRLSNTDRRSPNRPAAGEIAAAHFQRRNQDAPWNSLLPLRN